MNNDCNQNVKAGFAASNGSATVVWSNAAPQKPGWWWLDRNGETVVIKVIAQRAFGGRLCVFLPTCREWLPVEEITIDIIPARWGGPIPLPRESPNID